ncbi:MAG: anthranilate phosphoribosyltransferase [candidate division Zixibacteria bacterium]|nr:anthranilate phosphoribosyltransferase [candidate division Zixibacteria bacterium]
MREFLNKILAGEELTFNEAACAMDMIMNGEATPDQISELLLALKQKGESVDEVAGFVDSMRRHAVIIKVDDENAVDGCGTGGDGAHTFNISTGAAIVAAAAGVTVAKHGNRSVSSKCGSADLLEATGGCIDSGPDNVQENINSIGFGFMYAPRFHPAMKYAAAPRKKLGIRTVFNILGPMCNPALVKRQVIGVYDKTLLPLMADVLERTGSTNVVIAHSRDGLDEFSIAASTDYIELCDDKRINMTLSPEDVGLTTHPRDALIGGDAAFNMRILRTILEGRHDPYRDAVAFNAGAMICVAGRAESIKDGVIQAMRVLDNGAARQKLEDWVKASNTDD